jgi:nitronate monooxygenase
MIRTALTELLGIDHPIIQAGMGSESGPSLASAVANAGALGTLGTIATSPEKVREAIARCRALTVRPFALIA